MCKRFRQKIRFKPQRPIPKKPNFHVPEKTDFIEKFNINLGDESKTEKFIENLRELISIMFAIVLALGLEKFNQTEFSPYDLFVLLLAYSLVISSWWGYHWGRIQGPPEKNTLCYLIDFILVITYWFLINKTQNILFLMSAYIFIFFLYFLWENIRFLNERNTIIKNAAYNNFKFTLFFLFLFILFYLLKTENIKIYLQIENVNFYELWNHNIIEYLILIIISFTTFHYRLEISRIYKSTE